MTDKTRLGLGSKNAKVTENVMIEKEYIMYSAFIKLLVFLV